MTMKMRPSNVRDSVGTGNGKASYSDKRQHKIVEAERNERVVSSGRNRTSDQLISENTEIQNITLQSIRQEATQDS